MSDLNTLRKDVIEELKDRAIEYPDNFEGGCEGDVIFEIADNNVPIHTHDLLTLACDNLSLATDEPELGPAFDGSPTPVNIIAANVYEWITGVLWEAWEDNKEEWIAE